ncbi:MAG: ABC transporter permease, partial [Jatrophihabitans sp.]
MIGFGLRLTLRGGREALLRLLVVTGAVALGAGLLLTTLATLNAVNAQNSRYAWLETGAGGPQEHRTTPETTAIWWRLSADEFTGSQIGVVDVAATGRRSPVPPGLSRLPGPGEYYASPALARLLRTTPADQLADRYPGHLAGQIGDAGLPSPDALIIVVGHTAAQLAHAPQAGLVDAISTTSPSSCNGPCYEIGLNERSIVLILSVVTAALLFPILVFVATATRLSAARREQRFAAMRLVGATPRQIAVISAVESTV